MISPESFEKKLYIPRNAEGEPNWEEIEIIRKVEEKLKQYPAFVGLSPYGSVVKGYSNESSDIDIKVVYDSSKIPDLDQVAFFSQVRNSLGEVASNKEVNLVMLIDIDKKSLLRCFEKEDKESLSIFQGKKGLSIYIERLSLMITGDKIKEYREFAREKIKGLKRRTRTFVMRDVLNNLVELDMGNFVGKISRRIPGLEKGQLTKSKEKLYRQRLEKLWGKW